MANRAGNQQLLAIAVAVINDWPTCAEFWRASASGVVGLVAELRLNTDHVAGMQQRHPS